MSLSDNHEDEDNTVQRRLPGRRNNGVLSGLMLAAAGVILAFSGQAFQQWMGGGFAALGVGWLVTSFRPADPARARLIRYAGIALFVLALVLFVLAFVARTGA